LNNVINIKQERKDIIENDFLMSIAPTHNLGNATDDETTKKPTALHIPLEGLLEPETSWTRKRRKKYQLIQQNFSINKCWIFSFANP